MREIFFEQNVDSPGFEQYLVESRLLKESNDEICSSKSDQRMENFQAPRVNASKYGLSVPSIDPFLEESGKNL